MAVAVTVGPVPPTLPTQDSCPGKRLLAKPLVGILCSAIKVLSWRGGVILKFSDCCFQSLEVGLGSWELELEEVVKRLTWMMETF